MLQKVIRHGFEFWEAPRNTGPVFEEVDSECQYRAEWRRFCRKRFELLTKIVALAVLGDTTGARGPYGKRVEDSNDPEVWGDLVQFSDDEPLEVLAQMGIEREPKAEDVEPDMADIQDRAMAAFEVTQQEFFEQNRRKEVALCRNVSMALCRAHTSRTAEEIGEAHGRDHAAVSRAVKRVRKLRARDARFDLIVTQIQAEMLPMAMAA